MTTRPTLLALATFWLLATGCAQEQHSALQTAQRESTVETVAVVETVDQKTREVRLRAANGELVDLVAGPEIRNLPQLAVGDRVRVTYYESVAARMAEPGAGGPTTAAAVAGRAPQGQKPAGLLGATVNMVVTMVSYDPASAVATFTTPEGTTESVVVHPAMRAFAAARKPGDRVDVQLTSAVAVSIVETGS
jgi:hypothetical protein